MQEKINAIGCKILKTVDKLNNSTVTESLVFKFVITEIVISNNFISKNNFCDVINNILFF